MRITEQPSHYSDLDKMSTRQLLCGINAEDKTVPFAVEKCIPQIEKLVDGAVERMKRGGRLGIVDASEIPPTYGIPHGVVVGIIAGGDGAIRKAVENAEDDARQGWRDILAFNPTANDTLLGIASSGRTPYVVGALENARKLGMLTAGLVCNPDSAVAAASEIPIEAVVGPEFVTGSTRMKSGTAQKLILNMISTSIMIKMGRVRGNKMVDMHLSNVKLVDRGAHMVMDETGITDYEQAKALLLKHGSVRAAADAYSASKK